MNSCGDCNACCKRAAIRFSEGVKDKDTLCSRYCNGCTIYANRPSVCRDFNCLWLQAEMPIELRPDHTGVMVYVKPDAGGGMRIMLEEVEPNSFDVRNLTPAQVDLVTNVSSIAAIQEVPTRLLHRTYDWRLQQVDLPLMLLEAA